VMRLVNISHCIKTVCSASQQLNGALVRWRAAFLVTFVLPIQNQQSAIFDRHDVQHSLAAACAVEIILKAVQLSTLRSLALSLGH
jgi:hypothetical protein